jgi:hypothetical protein
LNGPRAALNPPYGGNHRKQKARRGFPHRKPGSPGLRTHENADLGPARDRRTLREFQFRE